MNIAIQIKSMVLLGQQETEWTRLVFTRRETDIFTRVPKIGRSAADHFTDPGF